MSKHVKIKTRVNLRLGCVDLIVKLPKCKPLIIECDSEGAFDVANKLATKAEQLHHHNGIVRQINGKKK